MKYLLNPNYFLSGLPNTNKTLQCEIWSCKDNLLEKKIDYLEFTEELLHRSHSDGETCDLTICRAVIQAGDERIIIAVKLRERIKDDKTKKTMTESEANNILICSQDSDLRQLFPKLYFMGIIETRNKTVRECIGMQRLHNLSEND